MSYFFIESVMDHYRNPRNKYEMSDADASFGDSNPTCGDAVKMFIKVKDGKIEKASFLGRGCALSMASASLLTEMVQGLDLKEAMKLTEQDIMKELGINELGPNRIKCVAISVKTLKMAIVQYEAAHKS